MAENGQFQRGAVQYPLTAATTNALVKDIDPALYLAGNFIAGVLQIHLGARLVAEAAKVGFAFTNAVSKLSFTEPSPVFLATDFRFPFLALYRQTTTFDEHTVVWEKDTSQWEMVYVLPPMTPAQTEALDPILRGVMVVVNNRISQGYDPAYQSGAKIWAQANIKRARVVSAKFGNYELLEQIDKLYRSVTLTLEVESRDFPVIGQFDVFEGVDLAVDEAAVDKTAVADLVDVTITLTPPTITGIVASSGTKAGGQSVTLTGTGFRVPAQVAIGGSQATSVAVTSSTSITCTTPAHNAYPTFMADVVVTNPDGQTATLTAGYTFTSP
jgi:hypothetical protein